MPDQPTRFQFATH